MKAEKSKFCIILFLVALCLNINILPVQALTEPTIIKLAGNENYPPFEFVSEDGTYQGFNVDIMRAIAKEMKIEIKFLPMHWSEAIEALDNQEVDALQGMTFSEARAKKYAFTEATVVNQQNIFILKDTQGINGPDDLKGHIVSYQKGDIAEESLKKYPETISLPIVDQEEAFSALLDKKAVAFAGQRWVGIYLAEHLGALEKIKIVGSPLNEEKYAIVTLKENQTVYKLLNAGLIRIKDNGVYETIYHKWFGEDFTNQAQLNKAIIMVAGAVLLGAIIIILIVLLIIRQLNKMVKQRTADLSDANKKLLIQQSEIATSALALEQSEIKFKTIFSNAPFGITLSDSVTGAYLDINPKYAEILGRSIEELKQIDWMSITHPADVQKDLENVELLVNNGNKSGEYSMQKRMLKPNGSIVWVNRRITTFEAIGKENPQHICMLEDITEEKHNEDALRESEERFRTIFEQAPFGIALTIMDTGITYGYNKSFINIVGRTSEELATISWVDYTHPDDIPRELKLMEQLSSGEIHGFQLDKRYLSKAGQVIWVKMIVEKVKFSEDSRFRYLCMIEDITERKSLEIALANEKNLLETTLLTVGEGVITTDEYGKITFINRIAEQLTGFLQFEAKGQAIAEVFNILSELTREKCEGIVTKALTLGEANRLIDIILVDKNKNECLIEASAMPILQGNGSINGAVLIFWDVSVQKSKEAEILYLSYHDQLTGLYNRRFYEAELARLDTERNLPLTLIMGDVNGLKLINDNFGHGAGDELLQKAAKILNEGCRADEIIARLGGDEFVILLPNTSAAEAEKIIQRIRELSAQESVCASDISIAFGYATKNRESESMNDIFKQAEDFMYQNKKEESKRSRD
ncbi:MAG: transporter substrate-binding domain-containing protein [Clostridia bacterium]